MARVALHLKRANWRIFTWERYAVSLGYAIDVGNFWYAHSIMRYKKAKKRWYLKFSNFLSSMCQAEEELEPKQPRRSAREIYRATKKKARILVLRLLLRTPFVRYHTLQRRRYFGLWRRQNRVAKPKRYRSLKTLKQKKWIRKYRFKSARLRSPRWRRRGVRKWGLRRFKFRFRRRLKLRRKLRLRSRLRMLRLRTRLTPRLELIIKRQLTKSRKKKITQKLYNLLERFKFRAVNVANSFFFWANLVQRKILSKQCRPRREYLRLSGIHALSFGDASIVPHWTLRRVLVKKNVRVLRKSSKLPLVRPSARRWLLRRKPIRGRKRFKRGYNPDLTRSHRQKRRWMKRIKKWRVIGLSYASRLARRQIPVGLACLARPRWLKRKRYVKRVWKPLHKLSIKAKRKLLTRRFSTSNFYHTARKCFFTYRRFNVVSKRYVRRFPMSPRSNRRFRKRRIARRRRP